VKVLVTGGAGFIGSNFIRSAFKKHPDWQIINLDKLTYAGNLENLADVSDDSRYRFVQGDLSDEKLVNQLFSEGIDFCLNFAAETHVDRSIGNPRDFIVTDVEGTYVLLEAAKKHGIKRFIQISTDEVYGSIDEGSFKEGDVLTPRNPYSASKAGADRLAYSYFTTYGLPAIVTRASNNFGPYQYPEKLIPLFVTNAIDDKPLPLYGDGLNVRDWLYVEDHCSALDFLLTKGTDGEVYNVGGGNECTNVEITQTILSILGKPESLIQKVKDRQGHDRRYSLSCEKLNLMGWKPEASFEQSLKKTVQWYQENESWWRKIKSGEYKEYYKKQYASR